jgi:uncharacterized protein YjhX (UPF0386 family)
MFRRLTFFSDFGTLNFKLKKFDMEHKTSIKEENDNEANRLLASKLRFRVPKLTKEQNRILEKIIEGAEIQIERENDQYIYTLCEDCGDTSTVRKDTFERLKESGLIKLKWKPSIDIERWG